MGIRSDRMTENERFSWEYSHYDSTGEIYDESRKEYLMTDYLQKYEIEEWCQELNKIVDENEQLKKENKELKKEVQEQEQRKWACLKEAHRLDLENEQLKQENKELKSLCKVLMTHIEKKSIAFVIDEEVRKLLE